MATEGEGDTTTPSWIFWAMANVFGGLRSVIDLVWRWGLVPVSNIPMDTLNTLLLGWLVFGVFMVVLVKFLYDKFLTGDQADEDDSEYPHQEGGGKEGPNLPAEGCKGPPPAPPVVTKKATIVPEALPSHTPAPVASGADPDAVRWVNNLLVWFFEGTEGGPIVRETWNDNLNENTVGAALETGVLIEILEFLPQTPAPILSNIIVDCSPTDDINITCDMTATLYMRVQTTRTQRDVTTESEYACAVRPLRGRLNIAVRTHQCIGFLKLDGWPEVSMELEGVRNNAEGLNELQLQEVVKEELTAALRKVSLELDFLSRKTFPRFSRGRAVPDHVIPVGYDALVRERQTHPPSFEQKIPASRNPAPPRVKAKASPLPTSPSPPIKVGETFPPSAGGHLPLPDDAKVLSESEESLLRRNLGGGHREDLPKGEPRREGPPLRESHSPGPPRAHAPLSRASMVFSSREKPIDEPNGRLTPERKADEEEEEEEEGFFVEGKSPPLVGPPPPPRSPSRDLEAVRDSLKETLKNNPFSKHLPKGLTGGGSSFTSTNQAVNSGGPPVGILGLNGKRLLVKVVKATGVGGDAGVSACYGVVEMDDPAQKFSTSVVQDTSSPFWDEQFLFDLSDNTLELLFEIYDKGDGRFLGLGIVGIEELVATPSQRQIIPLQARPYEKDQVSGSLTCEFLFLDRADLPDLTLRKTPAKTNSGKVKTTTKTYVKPNEEKQGEDEVSAPGVAEAALKDLEGRPAHPQPAPNTRSTLIIHASRKPVEEPRYEEDDDLDFKPGVSAVLGTGATTSTPLKGGTTPASPQISMTPPDAIPTPTAPQTPGSAFASPASNGFDSEDRGRSRNRGKRNFFGSLRRRFSRSKLRSKSVDPTGAAVGDPDRSLDAEGLGARSVSMERSTSVMRSRGLLTVPIGRGRSTPSGGGLGSGDSGSTRSSLSGTSGLSSASTKTYINEASLLVVETLENGIIKHYLVPLSLQRKNKWRKKGTKLHIYNEHTFVAKHLSSSIACQVCQKTLGRRLGKQGYECRDCSFKCHKPCHVKAETVCPNSTVNSMDLVYVKDERAERRKRLLSS